MRAGDRAYRQLLREILDGDLLPGTVLGEVEQAARLGVSRTPLREALARLTADGLLVQQSARVTAVSDVAADTVRELFEARRALEERAVALAAQRGDGETFRDLATQFAETRLEGEDALDDYYRLIAAFDAVVDAAVDNTYLTQALRTVRTHLVRVRRLARDNPERLAASVREHHTIASAIAAGDAELASHATHVHLHNALTSILASLPDRRAEDHDEGVA